MKMVANSSNEDRQFYLYTIKTIAVVGRVYNTENYANLVTIDGVSAIDGELNLFG